MDKYRRDQISKNIDEGVTRNSEAMRSQYTETKLNAILRSQSQILQILQTVLFSDIGLHAKEESDNG